ncbi:hypothetical protein OC834_004470 [Tilletia horrida]|nr:hypothetical protein OC834_004470 [Tilletia horrida]
MESQASGIDHPPLSSHSHSADDDLESAPISKKTGSDGAKATQETDVENALDSPANVFSKGRVAIIIFIAGLAAFISPFTANIFLPALPDVASDLGVSIDKVNLSVFIYLIAQGISPMFLGGSDAMGRRGIYLTCFIIYSGANAGLANLPNGDFAGLLVLRFMQACGSASMVAIGIGVVSDITTPASRGSLMAIVQAGATLGPAVGPVIGGVLSGAAGWRSIFWFTFALGALVLLLTLIFLPETLATARANHHIPLPIRKAWVDICTERKQQQQQQQQHQHHRPASLQEPSSAYEHGPRTIRSVAIRVLHACWSPFRALHVFKQPEVVLALFAVGLPFGCFYGTTVPLSDQFQSRYGLSTLQSGLIFIAPGVGVSLSSVVAGKMLDRSFRRVREEFDQDRTAKPQDGISPSPAGSAATSPTTVAAATSLLKALSKEETTALFPFEHARLAYLPFWFLLFAAALLAYGWTLERNVYLAVPIILTFFVGLGLGGLFSIINCIQVDYVGGKGASITAINNLCRCLLGAVFSAIVQSMIAAIGVGWSQTVFAGITLLSGLLPLALWYFGPRWRRARWTK